MGVIIKFDTVCELFFFFGGGGLFLIAKLKCIDENGLTKKIRKIILIKFREPLM